MLLPDPRLKAATKNDSAARAFLAELHQQILNNRDPRTVSTLLGKYVALAAFRTAPPPPSTLPSALATQQENAAFASISNILKTLHDVAMNSIQNIK